MKTHTRRAVAYITGRLISKTLATAIYDYSELKYFNINGDITDININVYDYNLSCYISGNGSQGIFSIYHYGNSKHLSLYIEADSFNGYDYDTRKHFSGNVNGNSISVYDYEECKYFNYAL